MYMPIPFNMLLITLLNLLLQLDCLSQQALKTSIKGFMHLLLLLLLLLLALQPLTFHLQLEEDVV